MATCVFDDIASKLATGTGEKEEPTPREVKVSNEISKAKIAVTPEKTWNPDQVMLVGLLACILVLSCVALVYAARS